MDDRELSKFIPRYGDRVLVRSFLRKQNSPKTRNPKRKSKGCIVSSLKQTLKAMKNKNKKKKVVQTQNRKIQVIDTLVTKMLLKKDKTGQFTKIWTQKGGGPRKLPINKSAKKDEIIKLGKQIYFGKDGISKLGK
ncbi:uncharacterized protein LOC127707331 [Mytilus californianus]|uniref:uncharacterized protein LOC127707331 n=1 Tax=Mytilus californianus TaxID=6549 RepID=UPI002245B45A|nr:uncharacterized protein LOC127707331 [Mytilus californianus]